MSDTVKIQWCGPEGHYSKLFGDLVPGRTYEAPADVAEGALAQPTFWTRPASKKATKEQ